MPNDDGLPPLPPLELYRIVPLGEAARLSSLSTDALKDNHAGKIIRLSPKRSGMRLGDALMLNLKKPAVTTK